MNNRVALGTVQFGINYGVANQAGRVEFEEALNILQLAAAHAIDTLDTAIAYGDSEITLGQAGVSDWKVVTKLSAIPVECADVAGWVESQIEGSLARLGICKLHGVLLHSPDQLLGKTGSLIFDALQKLKTKGLAQKVGISIYAPNELDALITGMDFDLVQAPLSILDRRLIESGWLSRLKERGVELHVRSVFLQGLLLMPIDQRPVRFNPWQSLWVEWERWLSETGLTPVQACLAYALSFSEIDRVVIGVDSVKQLNQVLAAAQSVLPDLPNWPRVIDPVLINPSQWSKL